VAQMPHMRVPQPAVVAQQRIAELFSRISAPVFNARIHIVMQWLPWQQLWCTA